MQTQDDMALVREFAAHQSEAAFETLVSRHVNLVYSAALRQAGDPLVAGEITQTVFILLARKAASLPDKTFLTGWLFKTTRYAALAERRTTTRRQRWEKEASMDTSTAETPDESAWTRIIPLLDEALADLNETDRRAVLLRYFENRPLAEVGAALALNEDAARKRVARSLEKLRAIFAKRGVTLTATAIAGALTVNAVQAAPVGLAFQITSASLLAGTTAHTATLLATTKTIAMTTLQKIIVTAALTATVGAWIYETHQAASLRQQVQVLQTGRIESDREVQPLSQDGNDAASRLAVLTAELAAAKSNNLELLKLRAEVTRLRTAPMPPHEQTAAAPVPPLVAKWADQVALLKQKLEQMPDKKIPELAFLTEKDWVDAVKGADLTTDDGVRQALSKLRSDAEDTFLNVMMKDAMKEYLAANGNILPASLNQLEPYFYEPVTDDMLARYQLLQSGTPDNKADLVKLTGPYADPEYDSNHGMSINGAWGGGFNLVQQAVRAAASAYANDNNGQMPDNSGQLTSYLKQPLDPGIAQNYLNEINASPQNADTAAIGPALKAYLEAHGGQYPQNASELQPYVTTPTQQSALQRLEQTQGAKAN